MYKLGQAFKAIVSLTIAACMFYIAVQSFKVMIHPPTAQQIDAGLDSFEAWLKAHGEKE